MPKIKMRNNLKPGSQYDYSLIDTQRRHSSLMFQDKVVGNSYPAVPRDEANIEVEGGETGVGDLNGDGIVDLMHFNGKKHTQGGMPVNVPKDTFIFSDTKNLTFKDPELIKKLFNLSVGKKGITPGALSKKFQLNNYADTLNDKNASPIEKRTADMMLKNNTKKLGTIALLQEGLKGFPDGVPDIAQSVMGELGVDPERLVNAFKKTQNPIGKAEYGGNIPRYDNGGDLPGLNVSNQKWLEGKFSGMVNKYKTAIVAAKNFNDPNYEENYKNIVTPFITDLTKAKGETSILSWGWMPGSDANTYDDMTNTLMEYKKIRTFHNNINKLHKIKDYLSTDKTMDGMIRYRKLNDYLSYLTKAIPGEYKTMTILQNSDHSAEVLSRYADILKNIKTGTSTNQSTNGNTPGQYGNIVKKLEVQPISNTTTTPPASSTPPPADKPPVRPAVRAQVYSGNGVKPSDINKDRAKLLSF